MGSLAHIAKLMEALGDYNAKPSKLRQGSLHITYEDGTYIDNDDELDVLIDDLQHNDGKNVWKLVHDFSVKDGHTL